MFAVDTAMAMTAKTTQKTYEKNTKTLCEVFSVIDDKNIETPNPMDYYYATKEIAAYVAIEESTPDASGNLLSEQFANLSATYVKYQNATEEDKTEYSRKLFVAYQLLYVSAFSDKSTQINFDNVRVMAQDIEGFVVATPTEISESNEAMVYGNATDLAITFNELNPVEQIMAVNMMNTQQMPQGISVMDQFMATVKKFSRFSEKTQHAGTQVGSMMCNVFGGAMNNERRLKELKKLNTVQIQNIINGVLDNYDDTIHDKAVINIIATVIEHYDDFTMPEG